MYDVAIAGSGPAGTCAAAVLAQRGLKVILLEKMDLPRYKTCGGGLVRRARALLPCDIKSASERQLSVAIMNLLETGQSFRAERTEAFLTMTMRSKLDHLLVAHAEKAGALVTTGQRVISLTRSKSSVTLATDHGQLKARFVIGADGVHSTVAKAAGWADPRLLAPALEWEIRVPDADLVRFGGAARFDFTPSFPGYAWVFPKRDHLSVGIVSVRRPAPELNQALRHYLNAVGICQILEERRHGFLIPLSVRSASLAKERVFLVGDAAGLADPVAAEGISHAIESGQQAARALLEAQLTAGKAEALYNTRLRETLLPELRAARCLSQLLYGFPRVRLWLFERFGQSLVDAMADIFTGDRTYRALLTDWRNYFKLLGPKSAI